MALTAHQKRIHRTGLIGAVVNSLLAVVKIIFGVLGNSSALLADGIHSFSDLICDFMVILAARFSSPEADDDHPYGHARVQTMATLGVGVFLIFVGLGIGYDGLIHLAHPSLVMPSHYTLWVALISVIANEGLFFYTLHQSKKINSDLLRANAWHSRGDSLSSAVVFVALIGVFAGWGFLDAVASLFVALMIVYMGVKWGFNAANELVDAGLDDRTLKEIRKKILSCPQVVDLHHLKSRKMAERVLLDVHVQVPPYISVSEGHFIVETVRYQLMKAFPMILDVTTHADVVADDDEVVSRFPPGRAQLFKKYSQTWQSLISPQYTLKEVVLHYLGDELELAFIIQGERCPTLKQSQTLTDRLTLAMADEPSINRVEVLWKY